jgi:hypothetical protein
VGPFFGLIPSWQKDAVQLQLEQNGLKIKELARILSAGDFLAQEHKQKPFDFAKPGFKHPLGNDLFLFFRNQFTQIDVADEANYLKGFAKSSFFSCSLSVLVL